jgi:site-specific recombinase XerD
VRQCLTRWGAFLDEAIRPAITRVALQATQMLRHGVPLDQIGLVLRHRGIDTTAYYAKADVDLLKDIARPWPEVLS